ncbi:enoyl-CoA hydratase/isomerase family protein [Halostella pelagica]|uniref:enoyl-CoA hydratase/isomerase family protein n=1 Tax=Halostella pelagica TaxID=2583824 RepID=UPI001080A650|nr:enoyl-CoA hydratase-related protein [Halostella pelagica]
MSTYEYLSVERIDGVGRIAMERADHHNALTVQMAGELRDATNDLAEDDEVRCLALTGSGGTFNTGADLSTFEGDATDGRRLRALASRLHGAVRNVATAKMPTVTGVNGVAAGGGFGLALSGDLVLVADDARFEFAYPEIALSGDGGSTYFLPRLVGHRRAREIALLDEPIPPAEAVEMGLATELVPAKEFDDRLAELAATLADGPTRAYGATKRLLNKSYARDLPAQLAAETDSISHLSRTSDYARGHDAFFGADDPDFTGE